MLTTYLPTLIRPKVLFKNLEENAPSLHQQHYSIRIKILSPNSENFLHLFNFFENAHDGNTVEILKYSHLHLFLKFQIEKLCIFHDARAHRDSVFSTSENGFC